jgi:Ca2+-binding RTX toxin-like protein
MAADLYLDFGAAFNWNSSQSQHVFTVEMLSDNRVNGPSASAVPGQLTSLADALVSRGVDYDENGSVNSADADALAQEVADMVARIYEPFAVTVRIVGSANMNQVIDKLDDHATNDAYVLVAGRHQDSTKFGRAQVDEGNVRDNVALAYAENLLDIAADMLDTGDHPLKYFVSTLARTVAHEAAHTFGLDHLPELDAGLTEDQAMIASSDLMFTVDSGRFQYMNLATRWTGVLNENGDPQNTFEVLAANVGLRAGGPAYVTGTGAHDDIRIEGLGNNLARVTVSAFRDSSRTDLIETQEYEINVAGGVLVEAGRRNDRVEVVDLAVPVTLRGGSGHDDLFGSDGNDTFEGDTGDDDMFGRAGSDAYVFRGPRFQLLGSDDVRDASGSDDALDFSQLAFAINVDLASTAEQSLDYVPRPFLTSFVLNGTVHQFTLYISLGRLNLDLAADAGSTGIENVRGTRFNDRIYGNELDNELFGNAGNDWLYGYDGVDALWGGRGEDDLYGGGKRDFLYGEMGRDRLFGEDGDDYLDGGYDRIADELSGGAGADEFVSYYRVTQKILPGSPFIQFTMELVESEDVRDFDAKLDRVVKRLIV